MKLDKHVTLLVGRVFLVMVLVMSGYEKLTHLARTADYLGSVGFHASAGTVAWLAGAVELAGGVALLIGWRTRGVALVLFVYLLPVIWITHLAVAHAATDPYVRLNETMQAMKSLAMAGGLLLLHVAGPGAHSVDGR